MVKGCEMVSIIVPVYNGMKYLERCLDSILRQSCSNMEIICIDDGSTDESHVILEEYEKKDNRVHYIFQNNSGVSAARNAGIRQAQGKYITFIDCDDYIEKNYIKNLLQYMDGKTDIVMTGFIDEKAGSIRKNQIFEQDVVLELNNDIRQKILADAVCPSTYSFFNVKRDMGFCIGKLYTRALIEENHIRFEESVNLGEDLLFFLNCLLYVSKLQYIHSEENEWYHYVFCSDSSSNKKNYFKYKEQEKYIEKAYEVSYKMKKMNVDEKYYKQALYVITVKMLASDLKLYFFERDFPEEFRAQRAIINQLITSKIWGEAIRQVKVRNIKHESRLLWLIFICLRYKKFYILEMLIRIYKFINCIFINRGCKNKILILVYSFWRK